MSIDVIGVNKGFGSFQAVDDVSLHLPGGALTALLGPSGSGKTTLLRIIAGLEQPDSGQVLFHGEDTTGVHVRERGVGFVFQHYALFRHMTVYDNVAYGLKVKPRRERPGKAEIHRQVMRLLELVQLDWTAQRYPSQLSGGQRQRIALARALAAQPKVLLLDEPFGALDAQVRAELRSWLRRLHHEIHLTTVFVTHDQAEALEVADRVVVMNRGRVEQEGSPQTVYDQPANAFVCRFLGEVNPWPEVAGGEVAYVRPHEIQLSLEPQAGGLPARVAAVSLAGPSLRVELHTERAQAPLQVQVPRSSAIAEALRPGVALWAQAQHTRVYPDPALAVSG